MLVAGGEVNIERAAIMLLERIPGRKDREDSLEKNINSTRRRKTLDLLVYETAGI
jgi:hypothetical protein